MRDQSLIKESKVKKWDKTKLVSHFGEGFNVKKKRRE